MSFTKASFQILSYFRHYLDTPYLVDMHHNCLTQNPKYSKKSKKHVAFCLAVAIPIILQPTYFIRLGLIFYSWKNYHMDLKLDQLTFFATQTAVFGLLNASNFLIVTQHHTLQNFISEVGRLGNGINATSNLKVGKLKLKEAFIYSLYLSALTMSFAFGLAPFVIDWEPI